MTFGVNVSPFPTFVTANDHGYISHKWDGQKCWETVVFLAANVIVLLKGLLNNTSFSVCNTLYICIKICLKQLRFKHFKQQSVVVVFFFLE